MFDVGFRHPPSCSSSSDHCSLKLRSDNVSEVEERREENSAFEDKKEALQVISISFSLQLHLQAFQFCESDLMSSKNNPDKHIL